MSTHWKRRIGSRLARFGDSPGIGRRTAAAVASLDRILANDSSNSSSNGEFWLLDRIGGPGEVTVFDVGAHKGEWSTRAAAVWPAAAIFAFEPIPETFERLKGTFDGDRRVEPVPVALSGPGNADELVMWTRGGSDTMSSAVPSGRTGVDEVRVRCTTGDRFMEERGLDHIDVLKIDVEGFEMDVLSGFASALERHEVDLVQFEFTLWAVHAQRWLGDYVEYFADLGYPVGRLMPRRVDWSTYRPSDERFLRSNYIAVRPGSDAARLLGGPDRPTSP